MSRLADAAWHDDLPATAAHQVRKSVAALRRSLPGGGRLIATEGAGYRAVVRTAQTDVGLFLQGLQRAHAALADGHAAQAAQELGATLGLWRGPVMGGDGGPAIAAASAALEERRLAASEQLLELRLQLGEAGELIGDLKELVAAHPLRETLRSQLMLALYRSGRQAEALEEYARARTLLAEELGIDPGPRLTALHEDILRGSCRLAESGPPSASAPAFRAPAPAWGALCTLPNDLTDFTGRDAELAWLLERGTAAGRSATAVLAIEGMGGSGKTALAVRAAHALAHWYPDGQLYVDLRGFSCGENPSSPVMVLDSLLRILSVPDERLPDGLDERVALWRMLLANREVLLVLDNAGDAAQVRPLLPSSQGCLVLVTSRVLNYLDGAEWMSVGVMSLEDSIALLAETVGKGRTTAEPEATAALAELCGRLPLALRIAGARLRRRPRWAVRDLVERLRDEDDRLDELIQGDRSVAAVISLSFQALAPSTRLAFRGLGLHPGRVFDVHSAAALLGMGLQQTETALEQLVDAHLLQPHDSGLYTFHDLVRSFARRAAGTPDGDARARETQAVEAPDGMAPDQRDAALLRLVGYYCAATDQACEVLFPGRTPWPGSTWEGMDARTPALLNSDRALAWFDQEHRTLLEAAALSHRLGAHAQTVHLARNTSFYLNLRGYFHDFHRMGELAVASARITSDPRGLRISLSNLAVAEWKLGRFSDGIRMAQEGLEIARQIGDPVGEGFCLDLLGLLHGALGHLTQACRHLEQGIRLHRSTGYDRQLAEALSNLSTVQSWQGRYEEAAASAEEAIRLNRKLEIQEHEVVAFTDLAVARLGTGDLVGALDCLRRAESLIDGSRMPENVALVLALSAAVRQRCGKGDGDGERACQDAERAMSLVRSKGTALRQAAVENILGRFHHHRGDHHRARELHESAYSRSWPIEYRMETARALHGMAEAEEALGDPVRAAERRRQAEELFKLMGLAPDGARWAEAGGSERRLPGTLVAGDQLMAGVPVRRVQCGAVGRGEDRGEARGEEDTGEGARQGGEPEHGLPS
ncbi:BTAD domain-containing putative transcriptional regulator [Streptomyces sp. CHB9.2]|uniref:AfsR/SARP family transcriptional regulator n=1 Tax=Streptomyces sp. CHB9.2 TaxID=2841670 RepID=UPI002095F40C|nr:BTAD domain-containing putative transcriptional regulator [Streptomyces sp. CHB9.2]